MDFAADNAVFFSDFASPGVLAGQDVAGIYSDPADIPGVGMQAAEPSYLVPEAALPTLTKGATLSIREGRGAGEWIVRKFVPNGNGEVRLMLTKVQA